MSAAHRRHALLCAGYVLACGFAYPLSQATDGVGSGHIGLHAALTVLMLAVWLTGRRAGERAQRLTLLAAAASLLLLAPVTPYTTHDPERYLWDGQVAASGFDPYRLAPDAPELAALRARWPTPAEHSAYPTLYPPAALASFAAAASAGLAAAPWIWKALVTAAALSSILLMNILLRRRGLLQHLPLFALSPLLILETGVGAHVDAFALLCLTAALLAVERARLTWAGAALGLGALFKLLPALALLPLAVSTGGRRALPLLAAALVVVLVAYGLTSALSWQAIGSLPQFFEHWRFGSPLFAALGASPILALGAVTSLAAAAWLARTRPLAGLQVALATPLLFSPVVFPWYALLLLPGLALAPSYFVLAWVTALPLTYEVLDGFVASGAWTPAAWPLWAIALAWLFGGALDLGEKSAKKNAHPPETVLSHSGPLRLGG